MFGLSPSTLGAINELRVCADLLLKGYEVFRSVSPGSSCDLAILKEGKLIRIEVKTAHLKSNGKLMNPVKKHRADVVALVFPESITYIPDLSEASIHGQNPSQEL